MVIKELLYIPQTLYYLFVEKSINNIYFNNCLYLWDNGGYIIRSYEYMKSTPDS